MKTLNIIKEQWLFYPNQDWSKDIEDYPDHGSLWKKQNKLYMQSNKHEKHTWSNGVNREVEMSEEQEQEQEGYVLHSHWKKRSAADDPDTIFSPAFIHKVKGRLQLGFSLFGSHKQSIFLFLFSFFFHFFFP